MKKRSPFTTCKRRFIDYAVVSLLNLRGAYEDMSLDTALIDKLPSYFKAKSGVNMTRVKEFGALFIACGEESFCPLAWKWKKRVLKEIGIKTFSVENYSSMTERQVIFVQDYYSTKMGLINC